MSRRPAVRAVVSAYIVVMRYTPLLIQICLLYFGLNLVGLVFPAFACGVLALMLQHGAFLAEVFRGAIEAIPEGQWMAGRSIGLRSARVFTRIILPQAIAKVCAPLGNQMVLLAKDTSLLAAIGVADPYRGESVKAFVVLKAGATATDREIVAFCRERLASFKAPRQVEFRKELPKSAIGKILRRELRDEERAKAATPPAPPER